ncbi:hypothetical protein FRX31_022838 [Thalictrum thalictroides]|uniref:Uncharacterized protein n=1 Tax=Thalictrum thalictroides TaxID=46969 RepID=A0A7J6VR66_THATH|nr:hypothetical protein FRX31_022838 [Thalictrum thalictroides]
MIFVRRSDSSSFRAIPMEEHFDALHISVSHVRSEAAIQRSSRVLKEGIRDVSECLPPASAIFASTSHYSIKLVKDICLYCYLPFHQNKPGYT